MTLDQIIAKIPRPIFVLGVLSIALIYIVMTNPMKDDCDVKRELFEGNVGGILISSKDKKDRKIHPKLKDWKEKCIEGNSIGSCTDYLNGLDKITKSLDNFPEHCHAKYIEDDPEEPKDKDEPVGDKLPLISTIKESLEIIPLLAWGSKAPNGVADKLGWLNEQHVRNFCKLKNYYISLTSEEDLQSVRAKVFKTYPDVWPADTPIEKQRPEDRPKAYKEANPPGKYTQQEIYERSLFSIRCDLFQ